MRLKGDLKWKCFITFLGLHPVRVGDQGHYWGPDSVTCGRPGLRRKESGCWGWRAGQGAQGGRCRARDRRDKQGSARGWLTFQALFLKSVNGYGLCGDSPLPRVLGRLINALAAPTSWLWSCIPGNLLPSPAPGGPLEQRMKVSCSKQMPLRDIFSSSPGSPQRQRPAAGTQGWPTGWTTKGTEGMLSTTALPPHPPGGVTQTLGVI